MRKHFRFERWAIELSALNSFVSIIARLGGAKSVEVLSHFLNTEQAIRVYYSVRLIGIVCPIAVTALLALKKVKKYDEAWLRHSKRYNNLRCETIDYINDIEIYKKCICQAKLEPKCI